MKIILTVILILCISGLSGQINGLKSTTIDNHDYQFSKENTEILQEALNRLKPGETLEIPEGIYDVETLFVPVNTHNLTITGKGIGKTILRRSGFQWDNNIQGDCPLRTEILIISNSNNLTLTGLTLEGNCHHIAISGYGKWEYSTGKFIEGLPQFPTFTGSDLYQGSGGTVLFIRLSDNLTIHDVEVKNGFRWAIFLSRLNGLNFHHNIIDTGNLSTEFRGHFDPPPFNEVMHMHTSQDGLHLVNVSNAIIEYNDIHSEDSGIAIELNLRGNNIGYDICENIRVNNNYVNTLSPKDPEKLLNDRDLIYGTGLANEWIGQSGVDIFYNEWWDKVGEIYVGGMNSPFRNIQIFQNCFDGVRYGVRAGFFIGAGSYHCNHHNHRIFNISVFDNNSRFSAGRDSAKIAGFRNIYKNTHKESWNQTGGAGIAIRNSDSVIIHNNEIEKVNGGLGISIVNVTNFRITENIIDQIYGKQLGIPGWFDWEGGEGIRIWNENSLAGDPNLVNGIFNAQNFLIEGNCIGETERSRIAVFSTGNGVVKRTMNFNLEQENLCSLKKSLLVENSENINTGVCK